MGKFLREHCIATFEQVGVFTVSSIQPRRRRGSDEVIQKQGGNVVTYFCTPEGQVLHFVVGPVTSETLLESAQWSHEFYRHLLGQAAAGKTLADRRLWMKAQHEDHLSQEPNVLDQVSKWIARKGLNDEKMANALWARKTGRDALRAIQARAGDQGHRLLRERPLPPLGEIEGLVFERLAGEAFSRRSHQLRERILKNIQDGRPILLMVANLPQRRWTSSPAYSVRQREPKFEDYFPEHVRVRRYLKSFHTEVLTAGELTAVTAAINQPPITTPPGVGPEYVILDREGKIVSVLTGRHSLSVLALLMEKYFVREQDKAAGRTESERSVFSRKQLAQSDLRLAKYLLSKRPEKARERLKKIVVKYPDSEVAFDALWLLARSGK